MVFLAKGSSANYVLKHLLYVLQQIMLLLSLNKLEGKRKRMGHDSYHKLTRLDCFSTAESEDIVRTLNTLQEHFTKRFVSTDIYFWTLGTSSYLDLAEAHGDNAQKTNDIIISNFDKFYLKIFKVLQMSTWGLR